MIFLGGSVDGPDWRKELMPLLDSRSITYFNPVVDDWTPEDQENEEKQKQHSDTLLYVIQRATSIYSIAEAAISVATEAHTLKKNVVIVFIYANTITAKTRRQLEAISRLLKPYGAIIIQSKRTEWDIRRLAGALEHIEVLK